MMRFVALATCVVLFQGCSAMQEAQQRQAQALDSFQRSIPVCNTQRECQVKWAAARNFINSHSGWKIQTMTERKLTCQADS